MREIRVETPDGHVWFVRRHWVWRRSPWRPMVDRTEEPYRRWRRARAAWERLRPGREIEHHPGVQTRASGFAEAGELSLALMALGVSLIALVVFGLGRLLWFQVMPWLGTQLTGVVCALAVAAVLAALGLDRRPWLVEAERQGLDGAPHRLWRVIGWRRSAGWARRVAAAIEAGELDRVPERDG
jgi:hypothetical protein